MTWKNNTVMFSAGVFAGALALVLIQQIGQSNISSAVADPGVPVGVESTDQIAALRAEYDLRISALTAENIDLQAEKNALEEAAGESRVNTPGSNPPRQYTVEELRKASEDYKQRNIAAGKKRRTEELLAAGYSMDQIEHLQRRAEDLAEQFRKSQADQLARGVWPLDPKKDLVLGAVLGVDPTFALKYEIGDAEYERYLAAQKRSTTIHVDGVSKGSIAAGAGIVPGDEIVTYDNERIFNSVQLMGLSTPRSTDIPGELVPVTVRRDGQMLQVMVPRGPLGTSQPLSDMIDTVIHMDAPLRLPPN